MMKNYQLTNKFMHATYNLSLYAFEYNHLKGWLGNPFCRILLWNICSFFNNPESKCDFYWTYVEHTVVTVSVRERIIWHSQRLRWLVTSGEMKQINSFRTVLCTSIHSNVSTQFKYPMVNRGLGYWSHI